MNDKEKYLKRKTKRCILCKHSNEKIISIKLHNIHISKQLLFNMF
jgi:hypothetical protein